MSRHTTEERSKETVGVRYTGWAALDRDPQQDVVEFVCPHCGCGGEKSARHPASSYRFTDGFMQDIQGETTSCRNCRTRIHVVPVVMVHDPKEKRRFQAIFAADIGSGTN